MFVHSPTETHAYLTEIQTTDRKGSRYSEDLGMKEGQPQNQLSVNRFKVFCYSVDAILLAQERVKWSALMNTVMNHRVL